jgi:hypothetical protein
VEETSKKIEKQGRINGRFANNKGTNKLSFALRRNKINGKF